MNKKNLKRKEEKCIALTQIFILTISVLTFAYFVGDEFKFVKAIDPDVKAATGTTQLTGLSVPDAKIPVELLNEGETLVIQGAPSMAPNPSDVLSGRVDTLSSFTGEGQIPVGGTGTAGYQGTPVGAYQQATYAEKAAYFTEQDAILAEKAARTKEIWSAIGTHAAAVVENAVIALGLYFGGKFIGEQIFGEDSPAAESLGKALALGYGIGSGVGVIASALGINTGIGGFLASSFGINTLIGTPLIGLGGGLVGLGIGLIIWALTAKNERIDTVQFTCSTWQPKTKGLDCEKCNKGQLPCTEYKCKSLGNCEFIINKATGENLCSWDDRNNVAPPIISSWSGALKENFVYVPESASLPADESGEKGVTIKYTGTNADNGCIPPFTVVPFGISLDKPGKCKMDIIRKDKFTEMGYDISGGDSIYNHTLIAFSPGLVEAGKENLTIQNGGNYSVYVRCESRNGYSNAGTFVFKFCVQNKPDKEVPTIIKTDPLNGMPISFGKTSQEVKFSTDKPSDCKWSHNDLDYDDMEQTMVSYSSIGKQGISDIGSDMLYLHTTTLTGLKDGVENKFYIKCKSYPLNEEKDRFANTESYVYNMPGTRVLVIDSFEPVDESTIKDSTDSVKVTLKAQTSAGYKDGEAWCSYNETSNPTSGKYILFANTESYQHSQDLWLEAGKYSYSINCCDLGGNCKTETTDFNVETDSSAPFVVRVYNEGQELKVVTSEDSSCVYDTVSCSYNFDDGIKLTTTDKRNHYTAWSTDSSFYIKCKDSYGTGPQDKCSVIVHPFSSY